MLVLAQAGEGAAPIYAHPMGYGWGWGMTAMHGIGWIVTLAIVVLVIVILLRALGPGMPLGGPSRERTPRELLDARYAAGEIGREDYLRMKKDLVDG